MGAGYQSARLRATIPSGVAGAAVVAVTHAALLRRAGYRTGYVGKWHMDGQRGPRPGFDFSASFVGQGRYVDCPFEVDGREVPTTGWVDDVSADYAVRFLRENKGGPFLLVVGFKSAHGPFRPPDRLKDAYAGERARPVPNLDVPAIYARDAGAAPAPAKAGAHNHHWKLSCHGSPPSRGRQRRVC